MGGAVSEHHRAAALPLLLLRTVLCHPHPQPHGQLVAAGDLCVLSHRTAAGQRIQTPHRSLHLRSNPHRVGTMHTLLPFPLQQRHSHLGRQHQCQIQLDHRVHQ